jgi:hypothetical protein
MTLPVTSGTEIISSHYNDIQAIMSDVLGMGENGYGLTLTLSDPVTNQNRSTAQVWQNLKTDIDIAYNHITNTGSSITTIVTGTTVISAAIINEYWTAANYVNDHRYECHPLQYFVDEDSGATLITDGGSSSRTSGWGLVPDRAITHVVNIVWATPAERSYFFNCGGILEWKPYHTNAPMVPGTTLNDLDTEWASFINYVQNRGGWDYNRQTYRDWDTTSTTYSSGTLRISILADQETDKSIRFVCTFTNAETPQLEIVPGNEYYNIIYI